MRFNDAVFGVILIIFAIAVIFHTTTFPSLYGQEYGPDLFPIIIVSGLALCGVILIVRGFASRSSVPLIQLDDWADDRSTVINVILLIGAMVFYILCSEWLGFVITAMLILTILMIRLGSGFLTSMITAVIVTLVIHSLFAKILLVPLPWGLLQPVAW